MRFINASLFLFGFLLSGTAAIAAKIDGFQEIIDVHRSKYQEAEHFSAIQVSIKAGKDISHYTSGTIARGENPAPLTPDHLFNIGSITKSFTAVLALKAEAREQLNLAQNLQQYLKEYPHWKMLRLTQLLDMTSGLPNYSDFPAMNMAFVNTPEKVWMPAEILALVYQKKFNPPLRSGYDYTNTGYILMDRILQQQSGQTFAHLLDKEIIKPLHLQQTFYPVPETREAVQKRLVSGYAYNVYNNPELLGRDMKDNNLSWAGAAGGIVANSGDVVHWVQAMFEDDRLLNPAQRKKMQTLVSTSSGERIAQTGSNERQGFGLGIIQSYDPKIGRYWFYEGETLGYRALYMYVPCNKVIISALFNSATNSENDHSGKLMMDLYHAVLKEHANLSGCETQD